MFENLPATSGHMKLAKLFSLKSRARLKLLKSEWGKDEANCPSLLSFFFFFYKTKAWTTIKNRNNYQYMIINHTKKHSLSSLIITVMGALLSNDAGSILLLGQSLLNLPVYALYNFLVPHIPHLWHRNSSTYLLRLLWWWSDMMSLAQCLLQSKCSVHGAYHYRYE